MKAYIEDDNVLIDRPEYMTVWTWEWNPSFGWFDTHAKDIYVGEGLKWKKQD